MTKRLLLVGWEAADWKLLNPLLDAGQLPMLNRLVEAGAMGDLFSTTPAVTAAQWTSLATGKRAWQHGITLSRELAPDRERHQPISATGRCCRPVWEMLAARNHRTVAVGWPATQHSRFTGGSLVSDRYSEPTVGPGIKPWPPAITGTYAPAELGATLDAIRMSPEDIQVDVMSQYVPEWKRIDQKHDRRLGQLRVVLAKDFCHQAAAIQLMQAGEWDFAAVRFPALGFLIQMFLAFQAPQQNWVTELDFQLYSGVVAQHCRMLDRMLAALCHVAGSQTTVMLVSPHGAARPNLPPTGYPANNEEAWKTPHGLFLVSGPGFASDGLVYGAGVLDVAPTILTSFGLPLGEDMEGRVLVEAFSPPPEILRVPTWEDPGVTPTPGAAPAPTGPLAEKMESEARWNLARSYLEAGRMAGALPVLEALFRSFPERADFAHAVFECQLNLEQLDAATATLEVLLETLPPGIFPLLVQAELACARRQGSRARQLVREAEKLQSTNPQALRRLGLLMLRLREWESLGRLAQAALQLNEQEPIAWLGLAEASLRQKKPAEAEAAASRALQLQYFLPDAHFILARALVAQNKWTQAREAMTALLKLQPDNKSAAGYQRRLGTEDRPEAER